MTSISQQPALPSQASSTASQSVAQVNASTPSTSGTSSPHAGAQAASAGRSYANATKKPFSPTSASHNSAAPAAGSSIHGKSDSISPVNGKNAIPPAVPTLGGPTIVNGNNAMNTMAGQGDHGRKPSVTISAAGTSGHMSNGGPVVGKPPGGNGIQFGSINTGASPAVSLITPQLGQTPNSLAVSSPNNPRITSPQTSPSPIPQPPASGGRPPSSLQGQGNGLSFGSLGGGEDASRQYRQSMPPGSLTPGMQATHLRRESSQSAHSDMGNPAMGPNAGRGGFPQQGGRGRGYGQPYPPQQMPYSPNTSFRPIPNQPRGGQNMTPQYSNQGRPLAPPFPHSPHQGARSPSLANSHPIQPQQGQMPMPSPQMQPHTPYGAFPQHMGPPQAQQYGMPQAYDQYGNFYPPYMQHPMQYMPPGSPRPPYAPQANQQHYIPGQYSNPPGSMSMSRTSSAVSDRPASTVGQPQTPMTPAVSHQVAANRGTNSPAPNKSNFQIPQRKNAGIVIKDPSSGVVKTFDKPPGSPALHAPPSKSPAIISGTPTPPPQTPSRAENKSVKTDEEKKNDMRDAIARKIEADREEEKRQMEEAKEVQEKEADKAEPQEPEVKQAEGATAEPEAPPVVTPEPDAEVASKPSDEEDEEAERLRKEKEEDEMYAEIERKEREAEELYQKKKADEKAEKERLEAEAAAREEEDLKQQEREAEAAEEARLKKLEETDGDDKQERISLFAALKKDEPAPPSPTIPATVDTPTQSGTATPVSETSSMPPPPRTTGTGKNKPAALKLETSKTVEAPQPSAALMSLRSARFLTVIDDATYPASIASPNPALNTNAPMGRFRYDINFLTQFQPVFVEKPSENWTQKVKETVGDTSETPSSARGPRTGGPLTGRNPSNRPSVLPTNSNFAFGFPINSGRTLPPGTSSDQRFGASQKGGTPIRYNANAPGGFPMGFTPQPTRTGSTNSMGHPQSPRNNPSHRGTGRSSKGGKPSRENDKDAKTMPLTAGVELKPIQISATGWKPMSVGQNAAGMAGPPPGGDGYLAPDVVQRKVKAALNKMTPSTFDKISNQILDIVAQSKKETDGRTLRQVIQLTFEKATDEAHWAQMYAEFCSCMLKYMTPEIRDETLPLDKNGNVTAGGTLFRKYLLNRCQQDFEAGWKAKLPEKPEGESEEAAMLSDAYYVAAAAKRRGLGLVRFIGELYKLEMLTSRIMHMCVKRLVDFEGMPDEAEVESLTGLLKTIGENLDKEEKARPSMNAYFDRIKAMVEVEGLPSRLRFMLMDIIDLRKKGWKTKDSATKGPVTLEEVRAQAAAAERDKEAQRTAENSRRGGGGGGRMNLGRGDARNFSGGNQFAPPPDYQKNTVDMNDLRRLGAKGGSRQASQQGMTLGPTSMFNSSRGSNNRKSLGPSMFSRGGEDSGASSRTATPPAQKKEREEKEAAHQNAFSALAALDSGEPADNPASPPSAASSPPVTTARPFSERPRSKSPLAKDTDEKTGGS